MDSNEFKVPKPAKPIVPENDRTIPGVFPEKKEAPEAPAEMPVQPENTVDLTPEIEAKEKEKLAEDKPKDSTISTEACPHCGMSPKDTQELQKPTDDDKKAWIRHILGEPRFIKEYRLMNDQLVIKLRTRTTLENDQIYAQLLDDLKKGDLPSDISILDNASYVLRMHRYMASACLYSITPLHTDVYRELKDYQEIEGKRRIVVAHNEVISKMPESLLSMILACQRRFENLVKTLTQHCDDPNFWKPTVG